MTFFPFGARWPLAAALFALLPGCALNPLGRFDPTPKVTQISPPRLGEKFAWGISTASYQYEDPAVTPGKPDYFSTDWDVLVAKGQAPTRGNALYSWSDFDKDLQALEKIRPTHYRFSIEWARVEPQPGVYNEAAIAGYVRMARRLRALGIEPVICLWHFTFPEWLYDKNNPGNSNWLHPLARERWRAYVERMVRATAPYCRFYAPQNEPNGQIITAYLVGQWPPAMALALGHYQRAISESTGMFRDAAAIVKSIRPSAKILSIEALPWWEHALLDPGNLIYNTMLHGNTDHLDRIYDVCDLLGINYYYSQHPGPISLLSMAHRRGKNYTMMGWRINPEGLKKEIQRVARRYGKPMMITENGIATQNDAKRIWYLRNHLHAIGQAIQEGADVRGYFVWSLADNYEWHYGFEATFGLSTLDPKTKKLLLKPSAQFFSQTIRKHPTVASITRIAPQESFASLPSSSPPIYRRPAQTQPTIRSRLLRR